MADELTANKRDKNLIFTPHHIANFICKVVEIKESDKVIDPNCGYGSFLNAANSFTNNIFGIEVSKDVYDVAYKDFGDNVMNSDFFDCENLIREKKPTIALMNPPFNLSGDKTNGFVFVERMLDWMNGGYLVAILPISCAIGTHKQIENTKIRILEKHTLDAVFTLPSDLFHPNANVATCCMIFKVGIPNNTETFFGYYKNDGFEKRKKIGRIDVNDTWYKIEKQWLDLYRKRKSVEGLSAVRKVTADDEWLCEAYMETDYSQLRQSDFEKVLRDYIAFQIQTSDMI